MPRPLDPALVAQVRTDLAIDLYLTADQAIRRYGLGDYSIKLLKYSRVVRRTVVELRPAHWIRDSTPTMVLSLPAAPDPVYFTGVEHVLGLAETRWALRDRLTHWQAAIKGPEHQHIIDVIAHDHSGELLVEYDTGLYRPARVLRKAERARLLGRRQLWATPSEGKARRLAELVPDAEIWLVRWTDGTASPVHRPPSETPQLTPATLAATS